MSVVVDTNVLVRMFTGDDPRQSEIAERFLLSNEIVIPNQTLCELIWVLRRLYKFTAAELRLAIEELLQTERIILDRAAVANGIDFMDAGGDFADGIIAAEGLRLGGEFFATFDRKAAAVFDQTGRKCYLLGED
ncbi:type II toxin-antitoxin system VapC family toxin [Neorhizobium sp. P12A]|uniref:type II toxin-antitoxin system VapC family toxin n=1 Tax=Neorhizobium sp. P12A TaxID=2268027 RepID=UPI0011ECD5BB|nr:type II toxin-antitoxin system VapC family toxin [Neorhizobium sp. P12A]KAA0700484.1 type II toxin-antitoxin system VapC family toxin [Neorhizobium sp. P12A]